MNESSKFLVYGLVDPRTCMVRYVGKSCSGLSRPRQHSKRGPSTGPHCSAWVGQLQANGLGYEIAILETRESSEGLSDAERWWIAYGRACGWPLTNLTDGGDGLTNPTAETRARMAAANRGRRATPETRARLSAAQMGHVVTAATRAKIAASKFGDLNPSKRPEVVAKANATKISNRAERDGWDEREFYGMNEREEGL